MAVMRVEKNSNYQIYKCLWQWAKRRHKHKGHKWIAKRYWHHINNRVWTFAAVLNPGNKNTDATYGNKAESDSIGNQRTTQRYLRLLVKSKR